MAKLVGTDDLFMLTVSKSGLAILLAALVIMKAEEGHLLKPAERAALEEMLHGIRQGLMVDLETTEEEDA
jgi:hypothetical protein